MYHYIALPSPLPRGTPRSRTPSPPELFSALKSLATDLELVEPTATWGDFVSETRWCRHYLRACISAPPLADISRLPPHDYCWDCYRFCGACRCHWEGMADMTLSRCDALCDVVTAFRRHERLWGMMADATSDKGGLWAHRRLKLAEVREAIGAEAWAAGE